MREPIFTMLHASRQSLIGIFLPLILLMSVPAAVQAQEENGNHRPTQGDGSPQEPISVDFDDVSILEVIDTLGALTGRNFDVSSLSGAGANKKVTIISSHQIQPEMAYDLLEAILTSNGFAMVDTLEGNLVRVVSTGQQAAAGVDADKLEVYTDTRKPHIGFDNFAIHLIQLTHIGVEEASQVLQMVASPRVKLTPFLNTNMLLIIDTADGIRNIFEVLEKIDVPGYEVELEIFPLEYTRAEALAEQLNEVLGDGASGGSSRPGQPARPVQPRNPRTANVPGQSQIRSVGNAEETLRMVPDERLNSLIVVASSSMMEQVKYMIERLDTPTPFESNNMHYVELMHTDAESVATVLSSVTSTAPREGSTTAANSGEVQPFEKKVTVTPYEENNALFITASPQDFAVLQDLIAQLDTPRKQVNVEAIIMQVTLGTTHEVGVEMAAFDEDHVFGLSNVANIANVIAGGPSTLTGPGGTVGIIDGTTDILVGGVSQTVQNVPLLIKALETITDVEILSRPNLLMKDNTEGNLNVGKDIPIPTAQSDVNPNSGFVSRNSISRRNVGIELRVTPQINEGEYVSLEIFVESSAPVSSDIGIDANTTGATIAQSIIESEVVVRDGQTGIIGGLISQGQSNGSGQVPILGDIPLLGALFRSKSHLRDKQNLVILVTPHIISRSEDMVALTEKSIQDFYTYDTDAIFQKGFIKKTKAKHKARTKERASDNFRPTQTQPAPIKRNDDTDLPQGNRGVLFEGAPSSQDSQ